MTEFSPAPPGAEELERAGMEKMFDSLQNDPDPHIRRYIAYLLGKNGDPRVIPLLVTALSDPDKGVREQSALALSDIGKAAIEPLKKAMEDPKWETRYRAVEALGKIADQEVVTPLIQALKDSQNHVRYMAAKGLQELQVSQSIDPLIALLSDENEYVRIMAVKGLGKIGGAKIRDALEHALAKEQSEKVRTAITEAMK
jgi:HEAT repeat protein